MSTVTELITSMKNTEFHEYLKTCGVIELLRSMGKSRMINGFLIQSHPRLILRVRCLDGADTKPIQDYLYDKLPLIAELPIKFDNRRR